MKFKDRRSNSYCGSGVKTRVLFSPPQAALALMLVNFSADNLNIIIYEIKEALTSKKSFILIYLVYLNIIKDLITDILM